MIRKATEADLPRCLEMARVLAAQRYPHVPFDEPTARATMQRLLQSGIFLVGGYGPDGMIGGRIVPCHFNQNYGIAGAAFWWAEPGKRGARLGVALARAFIREARDWGADEVCLNRERGKAWPAKAIPATEGERIYHIHV